MRKRYARDRRDRPDYWRQPGWGRPGSSITWRFLRAAGGGRLLFSLLLLALPLGVWGWLAEAGALTLYRGNAARVADGDTLTVEGRKIRLANIDAPELHQPCTRYGVSWPCGEEAKKALARLVEGRDIWCVSQDTDQYGRSAAECSLIKDGEKTSINGAMVRDGWALAYREFSVFYLGHEALARAEKKGVWNGDIEAPWDWRKKHRRK